MTPNMDATIHNTIKAATRDGRLENRPAPAGDSSSEVWAARTLTTVPARIVSGSVGQAATTAAKLGASQALRAAHALSTGRSRDARRWRILYLRQCCIGLRNAVSCRGL